jgi:transposase
MNDEALETALYANRRSKRGYRRHEEPDWSQAHCELKRKTFGPSTSAKNRDVLGQAPYFMVG